MFVRDKSFRFRCIHRGVSAHHSPAADAADVVQDGRTLEKGSSLLCLQKPKVTK